MRSEAFAQFSQGVRFRGHLTLQKKNRFFLLSTSALKSSFNIFSMAPSAFEPLNKSPMAFIWLPTNTTAKGKKNTVSQRPATV